MDACMRRIDPFFRAPMAAGGLCDLRFAYADELAERERAIEPRFELATSSPRTWRP